MENIDKIKSFLGCENTDEQDDKMVEVVKQHPDGLIERVYINKKIITEDGRQLLKEELPISNMK